MTSVAAPLPHDTSTVRRPARPSISDSYRLGRALLLMMLCVALDTRDFFDKGGPTRYVLLLIPLGVTVSIRMRNRTGRIRRLSSPDTILFVLTCVGLTGAIYGTIVLHTTSTTLPVFLPMLVAFTYLFTLRRPTDEEVRKLILGLAWVGLIYTFMNASANSDLAPSIFAEKVYRNSKVFFVLMGIAAAIAARRRGMLALMFILGVFVYFTYPSGTDVIVILVTILTFWMTRPGGSRLRSYIVAGLGIAIVALALINLPTTTSIANSYFGAVGKRDNSTTRLALWRGGIAEFEKSPIYGSVFSEEITILVYRQPDYRAPFKAPFHDDYVMLLATGGVLGLAVILWWLMITEQHVIRRYRGFLAAGQAPQAMLLRTLLVGFNVFFAAAMFNPELSSVGRGASIFTIYAMMMMLGRPDASGDLQPTNDLLTPIPGGP
jgi:hypothetical protein